MIIHKLALALVACGGALATAHAEYPERTMRILVPFTPQIHAGKARALAVTTAQRNNAFPDVPTMAESGLKGYESVAWYGMVAPAGLPAPVLAKLSGVVTSAPRSPDMRDALVKQGAEPVGSTPKEFGAFIKKETARYSAVIREKGVMTE